MESNRDNFHFFWNLLSLTRRIAFIYPYIMADAKLKALKNKEGRGIFLTVMLIPHTLFAFVLFLTLILEILFTGLIHLLVPLNLYGLVGLSTAILAPASAYFLWKWKKNGVYLLILFFLIYLLEYSLYWLQIGILPAYKSFTYQIRNDIWFFIAYFCFYFWAIWRKRKLFF